MSGGTVCHNRPRTGLRGSRRAAFGSARKIHRLSSAFHDALLEHLGAEITATQSTYPGTDLRPVFEPIQFS